MRLKHILLPLVAMTLCGCSKTDKLYKLNAYNSPNFYANYYLKNDTKNFVFTEKEETPLDIGCYSGLNGLHISDRGDYLWEDHLGNRKEKLWGYHNNLARVDESFKLGAISKLYDGRVRCDGLYQKSRAQLDCVGYDAKFPMTMSDCDYFAFSCRGGTTLAMPLESTMKISFTIGFFTIDETDNTKYVKHVYHLDNLDVETDHSSKTDLVSFYVERVNGKSVLANTVAMSFSWTCNDPKLDAFNLTIDRTIKEKDHLAIMLYEVFLGNSTWY